MVGDVLIKEVGVEAVSVIRKLADVAFRETYERILSAAQIDYMMEWMYSEHSLIRQITEEQNVFFIAELNGSEIGYAAVRPDFKNSSEEMKVFHLEKIYLLPEAQGKGVGEKLINQVSQFVRNLSDLDCVIELNVNRNNRAKKFYEKMGFLVVSEGDFPIGNGFFMNDYIMRKLL